MTASCWDECANFHLDINMIMKLAIRHPYIYDNESWENRLQGNLFRRLVVYEHKSQSSQVMDRKWISLMKIGRLSVTFRRLPAYYFDYLSQCRLVRGNDSWLYWNWLLSMHIERSYRVCFWHHNFDARCEQMKMLLMAIDIDTEWAAASTRFWFITQIAYFWSC